jgi:hypothetical protein
MNKELLQQNPNTAGALFLILLTTVLVIWTIAEMWILSLIFFAYQIRKAKKANENKKFIFVVNILAIIPFLLLMARVALFVISNLQEAGAI